MASDRSQNRNRIRSSYQSKGDAMESNQSSLIRRPKIRPANWPNRQLRSRVQPEVCPDLDPAQPASAWVAAHLGFTPDPRQAEFLDSSARRIALCTSRQSGKTQVAAAKALHSGLSRPATDYLLFAPVARQSANLLHRIRVFAKLLNLATHSDPAHESSLVLPNGSRFIALPGVPGNIRGFAAVQAVIVDEAAFVDDGIFPAVSPMLAVSNGSLWALSTPNGQTNVFYSLCNTPGNGWAVLRAAAADCPRISPEFLASERALHGDQLFAQEYECAFVSTAVQFLDRAVIAAALLPFVPQGVPAFGFNELFLGIDLGKRQDHTALVALEFHLTKAKDRDPYTGGFPTSAHLVVRYAESLPLGSDHLDLPARIRSVLASLPGPYKQVHLAVDATGESTLIEVLRRDPALRSHPLYPTCITGGHRNSALAGNYHGIPRPDLLTRLRTAFGTGRISLPPLTPGRAELENELIAFRSDGQQREHDDLVFALALAVWFAFDRQKEHLLPAVVRR
jgi:hypothetical protein